MSGYVSEPVWSHVPRSDRVQEEESTTNTHRNQQLHNASAAAATPMAQSGGSGRSNGGGGQEYNAVSTSQKMMSATWGSILTSLLGRNQPFFLLFPDSEIIYPAN